MKCKFCEQELPEGAEKCPNCGIPVRSNQTQEPSASMKSTYRTPEQVQQSDSAEEIETPEARYERIERTSRRNRWIAVACVLLVLILLVGGYFLFFSGYRAAIRRYVWGRGSMSGTRYCEIVPDSFLSRLSNEYSMNRKEIRDCLDGYFNYAKEQMEEDLGYNIEFAYERDEAMAYTDEETISEYETKLSDEYHITMSLDEIVLANVRISTTGDNRDMTDSVTLTLLKSGTKWYCMEAMEQVEYACEYKGYDLW